jgi:hypothetical protein
MIFCPKISYESIWNSTKNTIEQVKKVSKNELNIYVKNKASHAQMVSAPWK